MYSTFIQLILMNEKGILLAKSQIQQVTLKEFQNSPVVKTLCSQCGVPGSVPRWGIKMTHDAQCGKKKKKIEKNRYMYMYK